MRLHVARTLLRNIIKRANSDPVYFEQLREYPVETLVKEGLPYDLIEDFLQESALHAEVTGYLLPGCANTCALTGIEAYPKGFLSD